jgi:sulfatase modifying factor 1
VDQGILPEGLLRLPFRAAEGGIKADSVSVRAFRLDVRAVTTSEYLEFVRKNPRFRRSLVKTVSADDGYLKLWKSDLPPPSSLLSTPVTAVSWYASKAYCASVGKRLPTTAEWEWAANARLAGNADDSIAHERAILAWYSGSAQAAPGKPGTGTRNAYGIRDLHGLIWEWTADYNAWSGAGINKRGRSDDLSDPESRLSCGGAASGMVPDIAYTTYMRWAFRASLKPHYTVATLGFRCASDTPHSKER